MIYFCLVSHDYNHTHQWQLQLQSHKFTINYITIVNGS
jgi:hypothetical protein